MLHAFIFVSLFTGAAFAQQVEGGVVLDVRTVLTLLGTLGTFGAACAGIAGTFVTLRSRLQAVSTERERDREETHRALTALEAEVAKHNKLLYGENGDGGLLLKLSRAYDVLEALRATTLNR
jgi:uncharacterized membrane protein YciS (DUF1049 family)